MTTIKLNEQIAFLRRQKGITQEELAQELGVTNQSVSKWESGNCCPDIQLLPDISAYFGVSVDELLGYKPPESFGDVSLKIKSLFQTTEETSHFDLAYKLMFIIGEGALTKGYYNEFEGWNTGKVRSENDEFYKRGLSACGDPAGNSFIKGNSVFISSNTYHKPISDHDVREVYRAIEPLCNKNAIKVFYALYELTVSNFGFVSTEDIAEKCKLSVDIVESALDKLPVQLSPDGTGFCIEGTYRHIPPMLLMLTV